MSRLRRLRRFHSGRRGRQRRFGEEYHADAVHFDDGVLLSRAAALTQANSPIGFLTCWAKLGDLSTVFRNADDTLRVQFNASDRQIHVELAEASFTSFLSADTDVNSIPAADWFHLLVAWNTGFAAGSRRLAVYITDVLKPVTFSDDAGIAFDVQFTNVNDSRMGDGFDTFDIADTGLWVGSNIVEVNSTITEANRRKFIAANFKPTNPSLWPAGAVLDFRGDAAAFPTNLGTGGAFALAGELTNADSSPSD